MGAVVRVEVNHLDRHWVSLSHNGLSSSQVRACHRQAHHDPAYSIYFYISKEVEIFEENGELKDRGSTKGSKSETSTEDEWERVSENEKDKLRFQERVHVLEMIYPVGKTFAL